MSTPTIPPPAQVVLAVLSARWERVWPDLCRELEQCLGPVCHDSGLMDFTQTDYYDAELGTPIQRRLLGFERLAPMDSLPELKLWTNELEERHARPDGRRRCNLDPGLLTLERLVLATGKNYTHRIYLGRGIWADLTLIYQFGAWRSFPWTFGDYAGPRLQEHLTRLRERYKSALDRENHGD
jgi:hypothetical protein